jgi:predicted short-subunit dehydrogenase-like oxidoreductase (DUF2520 family)
MAKRSKVKGKRPTVSLIGMGRVGCALAYVLYEAGYPLAGLVFRSMQKAETYRSLFPGVLLLDSNRLAKLPYSDVLLITTDDDAIELTARNVADLYPDRGNGVVLHTSGALSSEALAPLSEIGFSAGSMHPLVSVGYIVEGAAALLGASYCLEGHPQAVSMAQNIVRDLQGKSFFIKTEHKVLYHAAAVMASPHLIALFDLALELLSNAMKTEDAAKLLLGLVESTVQNLHVRPPLTGVRDTAWALTGTFARGDVGTVQRHLKVLTTGKPKPPGDALEVYKLLGLRSLQIAKRHGLDPKKIRQITKLLEASGTTSHENSKMGASKNR